MKGDQTKKKIDADEKEIDLLDKEGHKVPLQEYESGPEPKKPELETQPDTFTWGALSEPNVDASCATLYWTPLRPNRSAVLRAFASVELDRSVCGTNIVLSGVVGGFVVSRWAS